MKYIFFDIDGTLLCWTKVNGQTVRYVPDSTKLALKKLREAGFFLAIATGRSWGMSQGYLEELGFENMVFDGGCGICLDGKFVKTEPLNKDYCIEAIKECEQLGIPYAFSPNSEPYRLDPNGKFDDATHDDYVQSIPIDNVNLDDYENIHKMYIACPYPVEDTLKFTKKLPWCRYHNGYFFVEPCDKAKGIKEMVNHFNGSYDDVVVFGDELNDVSMFKDQWLKIAMGNANPKLKQLADYVTDPIDQDGIYNACVHFGWIKNEEK